MDILSSGTWTEGNKSHLIIPDFEPTAVKGMLHFAYTGELSNDIQDHLAKARFGLSKFSTQTKTPINLLTFPRSYITCTESTIKFANLVSCGLFKISWPTYLRVIQIYRNLYLLEEKHGYVV